jgi:hypothetical protein
MSMSPRLLELGETAARGRKRLDVTRLVKFPNNKQLL